MTQRGVLCVLHCLLRYSVKASIICLNGRADAGSGHITARRILVSAGAMQHLLTGFNSRTGMLGIWSRGGQEVRTSKTWPAASAALMRGLWKCAEVNLGAWSCRGGAHLRVWESWKGSWTIPWPHHSQGLVFSPLFIPGKTNAVFFWGSVRMTCTDVIWCEWKATQRLKEASFLFPADHHLKCQSVQLRIVFCLLINPYCFSFFKLCDNGWIIKNVKQYWICDVLITARSKVIYVI